MNTKSTNKLAGFFLDIGRYTFDYLFDNDKSKVRILLSNDNEKKVMKTLLERCEIPTSNSLSDIISISIEDFGLSANYISDEYDMTFTQFIEMLYKYAEKDDQAVKTMVEKRLFKESLDYGFRRIGFK